MLSRNEVSAQLKNNFKHVIEQNKINHVGQLNQSCRAIKSINQSINQSIIKSLMLGPPPKPVYFSMN